MRQRVFVPAGQGRLLAELPDYVSSMNITFTTAEASGQHPQFHITPEFGWMNDPNGMFQLGALYHVFFQYNPVAGTEQPVLPLAALQHVCIILKLNSNS